MGNRIKGVVVSKNPNFERTGEELLPEPSPIAERAERVKEYREKRSERAESAEMSEKVQTAEDAVIKKPYVVGIGGLERVRSRVEESESAARKSGDKGIFGFENGRGFVSVDEKEEKPREIAFFSEPKRVKKKTQRSIFIFQSAVCAAVCLIMLISKLAVPQLYENLHIYMTRLFGC